MWIGIGSHPMFPYWGWVYLVLCPMIETREVHLWDRRVRFYLPKINADIFFLLRNLTPNKGLIPLNCNRAMKWNKDLSHSCWKRVISSLHHATEDGQQQVNVDQRALLYVVDSVLKRAPLDCQIWCRFYCLIVEHTSESSLRGAGKESTTVG